LTYNYYNAKWAVVHDLGKKRQICEYTTSYTRHCHPPENVVSLMNSDFGYLNSQVPDEIAIPLIHPNLVPGKNPSNEGGTTADGSMTEWDNAGIQGMCKIDYNWSCKI
jgi:hypothetical protein